MENEPLRIEVDERPDIKYNVELYNIKHERTEIFTTKAKDDKEVKKGLSLFTENGYKFISVQRAGGGHEPTRSEQRQEWER